MKAMLNVAPDVGVAASPDSARAQSGPDATRDTAAVVAPRPLAGKDPRALQAMIAEAFAELEEAADREGDAALPATIQQPQPVRRLGAAAGSELRHKPTVAGRLLKTISGIAIALVVGVVPFQRVTSLVSSEAYVDAPVYLVTAPADGVIRISQLSIGSLVMRDTPLALIEGPTGSAGDVAVVSGVKGKVWEVRFQSGDRVAKGDLLARVVGCSATSVIASVSEAVYDRLVPAMPARFNFYGSARFFNGRVAGLLGHSNGTGSLAIGPRGVDGADYRVAVAMPDLGAVENCDVGRRGVVVFNPPAR
jgi:hypothetical protein